MIKKITLSHRLKKFFKWWVVLIIVLLIVARILLPHFVLKYVNKTLSEMKGYNGIVDDIDIFLIRGAYTIKDIRIWETDTETKGEDLNPFFKSAIIDLSVEWRSLLRGRFVGEMKIHDPIMNFKNKKTDKSSIQSDTAAFYKLVRKLIPLTINTLSVDNGEIHYIDKYSSPKIDVAMNNVKATANNLTNVLNKDTLLPAKIIGTGNAYGGTFTVNVNLDPINKYPTFDLNAEMKNLDLTRVNDFLRAYGNFDVAKGIFNVYSEFAARDGKFNGYIKPLIKNLDVVQWNKEEGSVVQIIWETVVATVASVLTNQKKQQFATKINIQGDFTKTNVSLWTAVKYVIVNAWIEALKPNLDHTISIKNATFKEDKKNFFKAIFGKDEKKNKKKKVDNKK